MTEVAGKKGLNHDDPRRAEARMASLTVDLEQAYRFIEWLTSDMNARVIFQTFDDRKSKARPERKELRWVATGPLAQHAAALQRFNSVGAGICIQINEGGRSSAEITRVRKCFIDDDNHCATCNHALEMHGSDGCHPAPNIPCSCSAFLAKPAIQFVLPPSAVVATSWDHHHGYFDLVNKEPIPLWRPMQTRLAAYYDTDKAMASSLNRVMRLPGFYNQKGEPFLVHFLSLNPERKYTFQQLIDAHPVDETKVDLKTPAMHTNEPEAPGDALVAIAEKTWRMLRDAGLHLKRVDPLTFNGPCPWYGHSDFRVKVLPSGAIWAACWHNHCFDDKTELFTRRGFVPFRQVTDETEVATRRADGVVEFHPPLARQRFSYNGDLLTFEGRSVDLHVTPDHGLFTRASTETDFHRVDAHKAARFSRTYHTSAATWGGTARATFTLPMAQGEDGRRLTRNNVQSVPMDAWLTLLGWWLAEGSLAAPRGARGRVNNYVVAIAKVSTKKAERTAIATAANRCGFHAHEGDPRNIIISSKQLHTYLRQFGHAENKYIPREFLELPPQQLRLLFDAICGGDGTKRRRARKNTNRGDAGFVCFTTVSRQLANDVQEIALKLGLGATLSDHARTSTGKTAFHVFFAGQEHQIPRKNVRKEHYEGEVFDVTVPNHVILVRRNGRACWSGNCGANKQMWPEVKKKLGIKTNVVVANVVRGDHPELAVRFLADARRDSPTPLVHTEGDWWRYSPVTGLYHVIDVSETAQVVSGYAGLTRATGTTITLKNTDRKGITNWAADLANNDTFFSVAPRGLMFSNGFVQLRNTELHLEPAHPDHRARITLPYPFDLAAPCARWQQYLDECFEGDADAALKIQCLREFIGVSLFGEAPRYETAVLLTGVGANGKSVFIDTITDLFPKVTTITPQDLSREYSRAHLAGVRLNAASEIPESEIIASEMFKAIVGGKLIDARHPRGRVFCFRPECGFLFSANRLPGVSDHTFAFWRRWRVIAWNRQFDQGDPTRLSPLARLAARVGVANPLAPKGHQDEHKAPLVTAARPLAPADRFLKDKIVATELPGIAAWAIRGAVEAQRRGALLEPPSSIDAILAWRNEADVVMQFLDTCCAFDGVTQTPGQLLYDAFRNWLGSRGHRLMSATTMGRRLHDLGIEPQASRSGQFFVLRLTVPTVNWH